MEIKVRALDETEEKSTAQVEEELLKKHEEQFDDTPKETSNIVDVKVEQPEAEEETSEPLQLKEEDVLSYIGDRYGKTIKSMDELIEKRETSSELPEDVSAYLKYKKDTGRNIEDYVKLNKDYSKVDPDKLLADYLYATEDGFDADDVDAMLSDFNFDEELDEESDIKKIKLAKKRAVSKAKKYFEEQQSLYKQPLESSPVESDGVNAEDLEEYKKYVAEAESYNEAAKRKSDWFTKKTDEVFNNEFKGFEFEVGDRKVTYSPGERSEVKNAQSDVTNFINKFLNKEGLMEDASGYHKALSVAMNPSKFAKFFYEQGKSDAVDSASRKSKNIDMDIRRAPETTNKGGLQIKAMSNVSNNNRLKIRSKRK